MTPSGNSAGKWLEGKFVFRDYAESVVAHNRPEYLSNVQACRNGGRIATTGQRREDVVRLARTEFDARQRDRRICTGLSARTFLETLLHFWSSPHTRYALDQ